MNKTQRIEYIKQNVLFVVLLIMTLIEIIGLKIPSLLIWFFFIFGLVVIQLVISYKTIIGRSPKTPE